MITDRYSVINYAGKIKCNVLFKIYQYSNEIKQYYHYGFTNYVS